MAGIDLTRGKGAGDVGRGIGTCSGLAIIALGLVAAVTTFAVN
jgi:hypothetical protein